MKTIAISFIFLFSIIPFCYAQEVPTKAGYIEEDITQEQYDYYVKNWSDYISINKRIYVPTVCEGYAMIIKSKDLEHEIGAVEQSFSHGDEIENVADIFALHWEVGTKLYKIKNVNPKNYIAIEWPDRTENRYFIYCAHSNKAERDMLEKQYKAILKEEQKSAKKAASNK